MSIDHSASSASSDPHAWLEGIESADAMAWVRTENQRTCSALEASPFFAAAARSAGRAGLTGANSRPHIIGRAVLQLLAR